MLVALAVAGDVEVVAWSRVGSVVALGDVVEGGAGGLMLCACGGLLITPCARDAGCTGGVCGGAGGLNAGCCDGGVLGAMTRRGGPVLVVPELCAGLGTVLGIIDMGLVIAETRGLVTRASGVAVDD